MEINEKWAYHSHSHIIYGTGQERIEYEFIQKTFTNNIISPYYNFDEKKSASEFKKAVKESDWVFVSELDGFVGEESYRDCETALKNKIPLFVIVKKGRDFLIRQVYDLKIIYAYNHIKYGVLIY